MAGKKRGRRQGPLNVVVIFLRSVENLLDVLIIWKIVSRSWRKMVKHFAGSPYKLWHAYCLGLLEWGVKIIKPHWPPLTMWFVYDLVTALNARSQSYFRKDRRISESKIQTCRHGVLPALTPLHGVLHTHHEGDCAVYDGRSAASFCLQSARYVYNQREKYNQWGFRRHFYPWKGG